MDELAYMYFKGKNKKQKQKKIVEVQPLIHTFEY